MLRDMPQVSNGRPMVQILISSIDMFVNFLRWLVIARIILSFFAMRGGAGPITQLVFSITEPILAPIRHAVARSPLGGSGMMLDFSPIIFFLLIGVVQNIVVHIILQFA